MASVRNQRQRIGENAARDFNQCKATGQQQRQQQCAAVLRPKFVGVMMMGIARTVIMEMPIVVPRVPVVGVRSVSHTGDYRSGM